MRGAGIITIFGLIVGIGAVMIGALIEGATLGGFMNLSAALIVIGGTVGATILQSTPDVLRRTWKSLPWLIRRLPDVNSEVHAQQAAYLLSAGQKDGPVKSSAELLEQTRSAGGPSLLELNEHYASRNAGDEGEWRSIDPFIIHGLNMFDQGLIKGDLRAALEEEMDAAEAMDRDAANLFEAAGGYAPTLGIVGAVIGLIRVVGNIADTEGLGAGIATAFVATLYGVGIANLILLPIAGRLDAYATQLGRVRKLYVEVIVRMGGSPQSVAAQIDGLRSPLVAENQSVLGIVRMLRKNQPTSAGRRAA